MTNLSKPNINNVVAYWKLEDLSDSSGNSNDLSNNGASSGSTGKINNCYSFDGSNDYMTDGDNGIDQGDYTVNLWFNANSLSRQNMFSFYDSGSWTKKMRMRIKDNGGNIDIRTDSSESSSSDFYVTSSSTVSTGNWYMMTAVRDNGKVTLYLDAGFEADDDNHGSYTMGSGTSIGATGGGSFVYPFDGLIDEVAIFDVALSSDEIKYLYNSSNPGIAQQYPFPEHQYADLFKGLVAGYDFKKDAKDFSGNGYDGTVSGATLTTDRFGIGDSCYSFDGSNDKITVGDMGIDAGDFTVNLWFNPDTLTLQDMFSWYNSGNWNQIMRMEVKDNTGTIRIRIDSSGGNFYINSVNTVSTGNWYMMTAVRKDGDVTLYLDAGFEADDDGHAAYTMGSNTGIGFNGGQFDQNFFDGKISNVLVYNKALTADEIQTLYDLTSKGKIYPYPQSRKGGITE